MPDVDLKLVMAEGDFLQRIGDELVGSPVDARGNVRNYGAKGDGTTDDTAAIQAAIDDLDAATVIIPAGTYIVNASLLVDPDTHLLVESGAKILSRRVGASNMSDAMIRNRDFAVPVDRFKLTGHGTICEDIAGGAKSVVVGVRGNDMLFEDVTLGPYQGGQAWIGCGDRIRINRLEVTGSDPVAGTGGIRFIGGNQFVATGCHVESGDDCLQFVPTPPGVTPVPEMANQSITNSSYIGCTGRSTSARFMIAFLTDGAGGTGGLVMSGSIRNCSFIACRGRGANRAVVLGTDTSTGKVDGLSFIDCRMELDAGSTNAHIVWMRAAAGTGGFTNIQYRGCTFYGNQDSSYAILSASAVGLSGNVSLTDCVVDTSATNLPIVSVESLDGVRIRGCEFRRARSAILVSGALTVKNMVIDACRFLNVPASAQAVNLNNAENLWVTNNYCTSVDNTSDFARFGPVVGTFHVSGNNVGTGTSSPWNNVGASVPTFAAGNSPSIGLTALTGTPTDTILRNLIVALAKQGLVTNSLT